MPPPETVLQGRFTIEKLIGTGGFGNVYIGRDTVTGEPVAIKCEHGTSRSWLYHEAKIMQQIGPNHQHDVLGVPTLKYFGPIGDYRVLVMTMLGPSLEDLHESLGRFTLKTTLMLVDQMILRLQYMHEQGFVHRDLKPDNFLMGTSRRSHILYIIDFGLSSKYRHTEGQHREMSTGRSFIGTTRYASLNTHLGRSQSRRDDMEQLAYIAIYMLRGKLPWSGLRLQDRDEKERVIGQMKNEMSIQQICSKCPRAFETFLTYTRCMKFEEDPQYNMCQMLFRSVLEESKLLYDYQFDWVVKKPQENLDDSQSCSGSSAKGIGMTSGMLSDGDVASLKGEDPQPANTAPVPSNQVAPPAAKPSPAEQKTPPTA